MRTIYHAKLPEASAAVFKGFSEKGLLVPPEVSGRVIARLILEADKDMEGAFLNYNSEKLEKYRT